MAVQREVWLNMIEQNLFDDLLTKVQGALKDDSAFIYSGGGVLLSTYLMPALLQVLRKVILLILYLRLNVQMQITITH